MFPLLTACGKSRPVERREGVVDAHQQIMEIYEGFKLYITDNDTRLPESMDDLAEYAVSKGQPDPRKFVSPYAEEGGPQGYAWMPRREPNVSNIWDETVLVYDAAAEARGLPAINVLIAEGSAVLVDRDELRRVMREHGLEPSAAEIEAENLEVKQAVRDMYPLK